MQRKLVLVVMCVLMIMALVVTGCASQGPISAKDFYKDAAVTMTLNLSAGGGHDLNARAFAPYFAKELGAKAVVIDNQAGGGGIAALNWGKNEAPRDGKNLLEFNGFNLAINEMLGIKSPATYKLLDFNVLGGWSSAPNAIAVTPSSPYKTLNDLVGAKGLKTGSASALGNTGLTGSMVAEILKIPDFQVIMGFPGTAEIQAAFYRGELNFLALEFETMVQAEKQGLAKIVGVFASERLPELPNIMAMGELPNMSAKDKRWLEINNQMVGVNRYYATPPEVPADRLQFLRDAFWRALSNKDFQSYMTQNKMPMYRPADYKEMTARAKGLTEMPEKQEFQTVITKFVKK